MVKRFLTPAILTLFLIAVVNGQIERSYNLPKLARAWNSIVSQTEKWNESMHRANELLKQRFNPRIVLTDPEGKRRETVVHYKAAREALLKQVEGLNQLIYEEDHESRRTVARVAN